ncbi:MAG: SRPBCC family protein [Caldimonas sp.]
MASLHHEIDVAVEPAEAWSAISDIEATDRLFPGVLTACRVEDGARVVTFANSLVVRELIVDIDPRRRRLAYASVGGSLTHHHATLQVFEAGTGGSRIVWSADFLPQSMAGLVDGLMVQGSRALRQALLDRFR